MGYVTKSSAWLLSAALTIMPFNAVASASTKRPACTKTRNGQTHTGAVCKKTVVVWRWVPILAQTATTTVPASTVPKAVTTTIAPTTIAPTTIAPTTSTSLPATTSTSLPATAATIVILATPQIEPVTTTSLPLSTVVSITTTSAPVAPVTTTIKSFGPPPPPLHNVPPIPCETIRGQGIIASTQPCFDCWLWDGERFSPCDPTGGVLNGPIYGPGPVIGPTFPSNARTVCAWSIPYCYVVQNPDAPVTTAPVNDF
jgi:hypothetical protein